MKFAVVDIETTGGYADGHRITEVAVVLHNGQKVEQVWETLVNPGRDIPPYITALTGISEEMVADAPDFDEVAGKIAELTEDRVFVAHNVNFDYSFIKSEMESAGLLWRRKKLCTVRLSRKLLPGLRYYGLGRLCDAMGIEHIERHRAAADAKATADLLTILVDRDETGVIEGAVKANSREALLPPNVPKEHFEALPEKPGVYYFKDAKGKVLYVGKAKRLKTRVAGHFTGKQQANWQKQGLMKRTYTIDFELTGNEFTAFLLEAHEIKKHWPRYNQAQKQNLPRYGLVHYEDGYGYIRFGIHKLKRFQQPLVTFHSMAEARNYLWEMVFDHQLCARLVGLQPGMGPCAETIHGQCDGACTAEVAPGLYNERAHAVLAEVQAEKPSLAIVGRGRKRGERSVVVVEKGKYLGFGYTGMREVVPELKQLKKIITRYKEYPEVRSIVATQLRNAASHEILKL